MAGKKGEPKGKAGKGKGKDGKKGKKEDPNESEDASDAELLKAEESEETEVVEEEKEEKEEKEEENEVEKEKDEEEVAAEEPKKGKGKEKKGLPKAGVAKKLGRGKKAQQETEEEEGESNAAAAKKNTKGTSKLMMGLATDKKKKGAKGAEAKGQPKDSVEASPAEEEAAAPPKARAKRSLRSTSKLFLGFKNLGLRRPKKGQFKNTSRFFWGLHKHSTKKRKKKKNKAVLKSTSNLMMRFKQVGKKRKEEAKEEAKKESPSRPSFLLLRQGGQDPEDGALLFRRRPERKFKPRAQVLSKAAAATGWLARKVLSRRGRLVGGSRATDTAWLSRIGAKKLPFPAEDEILRHRANMKRIPGGVGLPAPGTSRQGSMARRPSRRRSQRAAAEPPVPRYGWAEEENGAYGRRRGYGKEDGAYSSRRGYARKEDGAYGPWRSHPKEEDGGYGPQHGYAEEDGAYGPWHGYSREEDGAYSPRHNYSEEEDGYMQSPAYPAGYGFEDAVTPYSDYPGYETEEEYDYYGGFWEDGDQPGHPYGDSELEDEGQFGGGSPLSLYDPYSSDPEYGEEAAGPFGYRGDPYEDFGEPFARGYPGGEYPEHRIQYSEGGWAPHAQSSCNPYALGLEEIAEGEEPEEWEEEEEEEKEYPFSILSGSSLRGMRETLSSKLSLNRKFRLFPRPQPMEGGGAAAEEGAGRYAVVTPQVQRLGSFRRASRMYKQHWSTQHVVRVREMPDAWTAEQGLPQQPTQRGRRWAGQWGADIARYLCQRPPAGGWRDRHPWADGYLGSKQPWRSKMQSLCSLPIVRYQEPQEEDGLEDMTQLEDLQEAAVLSNIRTRFERQLIYTYIGSILVSVNPYRLYNIYGKEQVLQYEGRALGENPPHLFAIANVAYSKVMDAKHNQCIVISGESGSGKTEATKLILSYLAAVSQKRSTAPQILEATPLLESFGNAKTVRNDNSSRFGKFVEIFLEDGLICGAITSQYLLEKSRVVFQAKSERNYHIFYEMLAGLPSQQRQRYCLQGAETYYYLNQGGNCEIPGKDDAEDFRRLLNTMEVLNFSVDEQNSIFRILSSVLHLGNVYFEKYETDCQEVATVVSATEIRTVAELLQVSPEGLQKAITFKVTETQREKIFTPLTVESAVDARDAIAKTLYSLLFSWLTDRINKLVYPRQEALSIAILDIYGFEDLNFNSFEQLCINYANEYLQFFFNRIVFQEEQEEYIREQIEWKEIPFSDNQPCIDLISQKPYGILRILDDQSCFPQATDHTFLQKCHYHHGTNPLYTKPKMPLPEFTIKHYAGKVTYQVHKFLDKNYDQVRQDVLDLFISSRTKVVANLFFGHAQVMARQRSLIRRSSTRTRRYKAPTVAARFQQSLLELVERMERCNPFFVRCIKPNNKKEPGLFEADVVKTQLRYSGILETIRIRKEGYPIRIPFLVFIDRYRCLVDMWSNVIPNGANCVEMLRSLCPVNPSMYYVGVTKLFLKEQLYQALESKRCRAHHLAALTLQRYARTFFIKRRFRSLRRKIILLQSRARGYLARQRYRRMRHTLIKFRSLVHIYVNRRRYLKRKEDARRRAEEEKERMKQELTRREVVDVTHLEIPAELMGLLEAAAAAREVNAGCVVLVPPPALQPDPQLTLPLDINDYPMAKYVRGHFQEPAFGMLTAPLKAPLTRLDEELCHEALSLFQLILRFMGDPGLGGKQETLFGNYIVQKGLSVPGLRDELLAQAANQVWRNTNVNNEERGWLLLAACLSAFPPSAAFDKYLLKFVSDYAFAGYKPVCQRKLMHAMARSQLGTAAARTFPPSLLEWTANRRQASMALDLHCFNGDQFSCPIHSWSTGEDLAGDVLKLRGLAEGWRGWSVAMKAGAHWAELAGHDYVLDLVSDLELLRGFPRQKSCFLIAWDGTESHSRDSRPVLGHGFDLDEVPPPPAVKAPTLPSMEAYHPHDGEFGEPRSQKGLDRYLDSLFDPVLSYGNGELEKPSILSQRLKGGGGVGGGSSGTDATRSDPPVAADTRQPRAAVGRRWPGEPVRHSRLNSEHFPRPTHDIRNIIRQCQPAPPAVGFSLGSKLFGKKLDPHEEAMQILKEQLSAARVPSAGGGPKEVVAAVKPVPSARQLLVVPPGDCKAFCPFTVFVSRELPSEAQQVQTQLHRSCSEDFYTYHNVPWKIFIRKEVQIMGTLGDTLVFYPKDSINNPLLLDLIFRQIFNDVLSDTCIRLSHEERLRLKSLFAENKLDSFSPVATENVKREIIAAARDGCEVYFSRLFPATGSVGTGVQILAVSHAGIKLLRVVKGTNVPGEQLRVLRAYSYPDVLFVTTPSRNMLEFNLRGEKLILFSPKAPQVKVMVDHFITELRKDSQYVVAVRNYSPEDGSQLSFHKGDIIHLQSLEHPERDHYYGCVVRKKVMYLEELKAGTQDFGWKFGAIHGRSGLFPAEYVQPVAAPDFVHLPAERKEEPRDKQGKVAASAAVAVAVASTAAAQELDRKTEVSPASATFVEGPEGDGIEQLRDVTGACPMLAFAQRHFRAARRGTTDSRGMKVPSVLEMLTFTKIPIQESLIEFVDGGLNKLAAEAFQAVMKFMGDHPLRGHTDLDVVCTILKLCAEHEVLRDEVYCQIIKQITNNTSSKPDSCQRGWRLLYILAAYYKCSEVLRPFLLAFLQDASRHPELPFHGIAKACEQNLRKTQQFGGRSLFPSSMELKAMVAGRSAKRQLFLLPGGIERHLKIKTCSVALDVIEELCCEMGLQNPEALEEYILFVVTDRGQSVRPLTRREYVLDVAAETELRDSSYTFWCRRVLWSQPLKFDNELYVTVHYNQVLPDYLKGLFTVLPPARPGEQHFPHVAKLAALQHRAKDRHHLPTAREMQDYVPPQLFRLLKPQSWLQMVTQHVQQAQALSAHQARAQFLGLLSAYPMFGSSFFYIQSCSNNAIVSPCILAVNQNGLNFLSKETHELIAKFSLNEIQSTRTQRPAAGSSSPYVEITLGDLLAQGITQLQLEQGLELCRVVAAHMERLLGAREKRLTLPPSEITLL
ncbi:Unconventional myosin-XV [Lonchura striata]|uniref:Unconventional myosin-XV n=1 Tax=Lonchura striata TaxID=40157 RepID=A0A218UW86_9PASE|nr:Unconventional myosin-XV [Lonchura striata domestica]